jgi:hypothetical protein
LTVQACCGLRGVMPEPTHQLMVEVTDVFGNVESEPLYVTVQGPMVRLECSDLRMVGFTEELRAVLQAGEQERAA